MFKNLSFVFLFVLGAGTIAFGQIETPAPSPSASFSQDVGLIEISGEYSRPGVKDRAIFGDLVPYDNLWRTGANAATKISFSGDVTVEGQSLKAGSYAVLTKPGMATWDVNFYAYESGSFGSYVEKEPTLSVTVTPVEIPVKIERFLITVADMHDNGAVLEFLWANTLVPVQIGVSTDAAVMASIDRVLSGPTAGDYYTAGSYLHNSGKDLEKALMYVQKATHGESPKFWQVRQESLILAKLGRKAEAIAAAKKSLELAKTAGNDDYVRMNEKSIKEWSM